MRVHEAAFNAELSSDLAVAESGLVKLDDEPLRFAAFYFIAHAG
jgi:hypothetical protein